MSARQGEEESIRFRSNRIECVNSQWFVEIREVSRPMGPFETKEQAKMAADAYIKDIQAGRPPITSMSDQFFPRTFSLK
ncbi:MAG: DUF6316 family protein [Porticoccus sp.]|nr:DUF6316 family protein [Porticoccus sp.]